MASGTRAVGEFCWINVLTPHPDQAREFFGGLLEWTYEEMGYGGHLIRVDGKMVGAMFDLNSPNTPPDTPANIGAMVKVASADGTAARVNELGGKAMPPMDIGENGRMVVCFDPNGANLDVWQAGKQPGMDVDSLVHGAPTWFETMTSDVEKARTFYTSLFGWSSDTQSMGEFDYTTFMLGETPVAGMMALLPHMEGVPPHWATYFTVRDVDAAVEKANELGGSICVPVQEIPNIGRFGGITSPQGIIFYVLQYAS